MKWKSPIIIFNKSWKCSHSTIYNPLSYFIHKEHKHEIYLIKRYKKVHYTYNRNLKYFCSKYFATKVSPIYKLNLYLPRRNPNYDWLRKKIARLYREESMGLCEVKATGCRSDFQGMCSVLRRVFFWPGHTHF